MFEITFDVKSMASTLEPEEVCENYNRPQTGYFSRTHADGWTISGWVKEDFCTWVNEFEASHPVFGRVWGDFEDKVFADSKEGYEAFNEAHSPHSWDYQDI